jgi:integrase
MYNQNFAQKPITQDDYYSDFEVDQIMAKLRSTNQFHSRDGLLIRLALACGARAKELLELKASSISFREGRDGKTFGVVTLVTAKQRKPRADKPQPLKPRKVKQVMRSVIIDQGLASELLAMKPQGLLFDICYQRLDQIWNKYRVNHKTFHALRHTYATRLYSKTKNLLLVQQSLGHRSSKNTEVYAHLVDALDQQAEAIVC